MSRVTGRQLGGGGYFPKANPVLLLCSTLVPLFHPLLILLLNMKYGGWSAFVLHISLCTCLSVCIMGGGGSSVCISTNHGLGPNPQMSPQQGA